MQSTANPLNTRWNTLVPPAGGMPRTRLEWLEICYGYLGIFYYEGAFISALARNRGDETKVGGQDFVSTIVQSSILLIMLGILSVRWRQMAHLLRYLKPYMLIVALSIASYFWSENPAPTLRRSISLTLCITFGVYLYHRFGFHRMLAMMSRTAVVAGFLSIIVFVAMPSIGHDRGQGYENAMCGVFSQKNPMAECMMLAISCVCYRILQENRIRPAWAVSIVLLLLCIVLGRSATSTSITMLVLLSTAFMYYHDRPILRLSIMMVLLWVVGSVIIASLVAPELLAAISGRDASFTGRVPLWQEVIKVIAERPLLGHGYAGFWTPDNVSTQHLWFMAGWPAPDAHNGYLDITVDTGLIGLVIYMYLWASVLRQAWHANKVDQYAPAKWALLFMMINYILNLDEGPLPFPDIFTLMMPAAILSVGEWSAWAKQQAWQADQGHDRAYYNRLMARSRPADPALSAPRAAG